MKKILLFFMAVFLTTVSLQAATSYGFYVGGVSVTSSNYDNVHGGDILSGSVVYNPSTNTVTLTNVTITCSGSNDNALWNDDCSGLTVKIVGTCNFTTRHRTISLYETTYFEIGSGSVLNVNLHDPLKDNEAAIYTQALLEFYGPGTLNVSAKTDDVSSHTSAAFEGHGSNTSSKLHFSNITAYISSNCQGIFDFNTVRFYSGSDVEISNSYGWVSPIFDTENVILYSDEAIVQPADAYYDPSAFDGRGEFVNATKYIHITDNYGAILSTANFPDDNFRSCMRSLYPKQWLTKAELQNLTTLDVHGQSISNLKGVEKLTYLQKLVCYSNSISSLDLTSNTKLTYLSCYSNAMTSLLVYNCSNLTYLDCAPNNLTSLNLSKLTNLQTLYCYDNQLTNITFASSTPNLQTVSCHSNNFTTFGLVGRHALKTLNINNCTSLTTLNCYDNDLTTLNVTGNSALTRLDCRANGSLSTVTGLAGCTALTYLDCDDCNFSSLNVSPLTKLTGLRCCNNQLTSLNVLALTSLQYLHCNGNKLTSLNVSSKTSLKELYCYNNQLTSLNVQGCSALTNIECDGNKLTSLYLQGCSSLKTLYCYCNQITGSGMTTLVSSLPTCSSSNPGNLYAIFDNAEGNTMTTAQITTALNKYWNPKRFNGIRWEDMTTGGLKGDVNNSGTVDISDVIDIINYVLTGNGTGLNLSVADVNEDNLVDVNDVTNVINYVLNGVW